MEKGVRGVMLERSELTRPLQPAPHLCLRLAARGYSYNTPESLAEVSAVELHCR